MKIVVKMSVNINEASAIIDLSDLDITKDEWEKMSDDDRKPAIIDFIDNLPEQPYWVLDSFCEKD